MGDRRRLRAICTLMALAYFAVALGRLTAGMLPLIDPALSTAQIHCSPNNCWLDIDSLRLLPDGEREAVAAQPARRAALESLIARPQTRAALFAAGIVRAVPAVLLFVGLAMTFRAFAAGLGVGIPLSWLRWTTTAAVAAVLAQPVADTIRETALSSVLIGAHRLHPSFDGGTFLWGLLVAGAVWTAVRMLDGARRSEAELAQIV